MGNRVTPKAKGYHWDQADAYVHPSNGRKSCRWCRGRVDLPKKTFCSALCVSEWKRRTHWQLTRLAVYARAHGLCSLCGFNLESVNVEHFLKQLHIGEKAVQVKKADWSRWAVKPETDPDGNLYPRRHWLDRIEYGMDWKRKAKVSGRDAWEVHHRIPVTAGGDYFDFSNLCLLDVLCHRNVTADYAAERARLRRLERIRLPGG